VLKQHTKAERLLRRALELHRDLENLLGEAEALTFLGLVQYSNSRMSESLDALQEACRLYRVIDNPLGLSNALFALADTLRDMGRHDEASENRSQALSVLHHIENDL
jgi:tetratricopeptide (TPR) repeat protein